MFILFRKHKLIVFITSFLLLFAFISPPNPLLPNVQAADTEQEKINKVISYAKSWLNKNVKYQMGGTRLVPGGAVDCSYFVQQAFKQVGINLPRTTWEQVSLGEPVSLANLKPGDLVFFNTYSDPYWNSKGNYSSHVGIYLGNNQFINAQQTGGILIQTLVGNGYWDKHFTQARRLIGSSAEKTLSLTGIIKTPSGLNVRSGPGTTYPRIGGVYYNDKVEIVGKSGDWYKIKFGSGYGYIIKTYVTIVADENQQKNTANPPKPKANQLRLVETITLYNSPTNNPLPSKVAPQTVNVISNWVKIKTWIGEKWINITERKVQIKLTEKTDLYDQPNGKKDQALAPQTVNVLEESNGWFKINTWIGERWIHPSNAVILLTVNQTTPLYDAPEGQKSNAAIAPQTVTVIEDWYKINTWLGEKWIMLNRSGSIFNPPGNPTGNLSEKDIFAEALAFTLGVEGGYVNDPSDYGGPTNLGITQSTYNRYLALKGKKAKSVKYITFEEAKEAYYLLYWKPANAHRMNRALAIVMFDTAVNLGLHGDAKKAGGAIKHLQKALNIAADGVWGKTTEKAFAAVPKSKHNELALKIISYNKAFRYERVKQDPSQRKYLEGWLNRDNKLENYIKRIIN